MSFRPTPEEERWLSVARQLGPHVHADFVAERSGDWRTAGLLSRCGFFVLGLIAAAAIAALSSLLITRSDLVLGGLLCIGAAEILILDRRFFWSGIEEALEATGLALMGFQCWEWFGSRAGAICCTVAFALAAWRLLNPLFPVLAALSFVWTFDASHLQSGLLCYAVALGALAAGARQILRPSYDRMLDYLVVAMPVAGYLWSEPSSGWDAAGNDYWHVTLSAWLVPICPLAFAVIALLTGIRRRTQAPILAGMLCVACGAYELRRLSGLSLEARLIIWGSLLLLTSAFMERYLRVPRRGITSRPIRDAAVDTNLLSAAGAAALTPHGSPTGPSPSFEGRGGGFAGGGASGKF